MNDKLKIIAFVILAGIVLFAVYKIMQGVGLIDDKDDKGQEALISNKAFTPITSAEIAKYRTKLLPSAEIARIATSVFSSNKGWDDDERAIGAMKGLKTKMQVKQLTLVFSLAPINKDLGAFLDFISDAGMRRLNTFINALPAS